MEHTQNAVDFIKSKGFNYIKVELEAVFGRGNFTKTTCSNCRDGERLCRSCDSLGIKGISALTGRLIKCGKCENGIIKCPQKHYNLNEIKGCQSWFDDRISKELKKKIVFRAFYHDPSVDTELTITIHIDDWKFLPEIVSVYKSIGEEIGGEIQTHGAGMHIALVNSPRGTYPAGCSVSPTLAQNMATNLLKLMPAFYLLAAADNRSRPAHFRLPQVSTQKYSAINYGSGVLEYRIFETCYKCPERILEFVGVIARTLEYYGSKQLPDDIKKMSYEFEMPTGNSVDRYYETTQMLDILDKTLPYLLPEGVTAEDVKKSRGFTVTHEGLKDRKKMLAIRAKSTWPEFSERLKYARETAKNRAEKDYDYRKRMYGPDFKKAKRTFVKEYVDNVSRDKPKNLKAYIETMTKERQRSIEIRVRI